MPNELTNALFGKPKELPPIIIDRSKAQRKATCPFSGYLADKIGDDEIQTALVKSAEITHDLIDEAVKYSLEIDGTTQHASEYFLEELLKTRPDLQPDIIKAAKHVAAQLMWVYDQIIGCEIQIDFQLYSERLTPKDYGPLVITTCLDLLMSKGSDCLVVWDWKTGYKRRDKATAMTDFQVCYICFILWQNYPDIEKIEFVFQETRWGSFVRVEFLRNAEHPKLPHLTTEVAFQGRIEEAVKLVLSNSKEAWPEEKKCSWCDVIRECAEANIWSKEIADDPAKYLDAHIIRAAMVKKEKSIISEYVKGGHELVGSACLAQKKKPKDTFTLEFVPIEPEKPKKKTKKKANTKKAKKTAKKTKKDSSKPSLL